MHASIVRSLLSIALLSSLARPTWADDAPRDAGDAEGWSVGTSVWMLANLLPDSGHFYYVEVDRSIDERGALVFEALTWTYHAPIGIPWVSSSYGQASEDYPGYVRSVGLGVGWRHDFYKGLNASVRTFHMLQRYHEDDRDPTTGYQLFLNARVGWRWRPLAFGFWVEPAVAFNWWPIEVGRPQSFASRDDRWPSYFLFEPWINLGWSW